MGLGVFQHPRGPFRSTSFLGGFASKAKLALERVNAAFNGEPNHPRAPHVHARRSFGQLGRDGVETGKKRLVDTYGCRMLGHVRATYSGT